MKNRSRLVLHHACLAVYKKKKREGKGFEGGRFRCYVELAMSRVSRAHEGRPAIDGGRRKS